MSWFVVGGIAIGATAGAIAGSKKGGDDVWKDALIGGAIGGVGAGVGAAAFAPAAEAAVPAAVGAEGGAGILGAEAAAGGSGLALGGAGLETGGAMAGGAGIAGGAAPAATMVAPEAGAGILGGSAAPAALPGGAGGFGSAGGASVGSMGGFAPGMQAPVQMIEAPAAAQFGSSSLPTGATALPGGEAFGGSGGATVGQTGGAYNLGSAPQNTSMFDKALGWVEENPFKAGILGFTALGLTGALNKNNNQTFGESTVTPAGYPLSPNFKPSRYQPTRTYASGGDVYGDYDGVEDDGYAEGGKINWEKQAKQFAAMTQAADAPETREPGFMGTSKVDPSDAGVFIDRDVETMDQPAHTAAQIRMQRLAKKYGVSYGPKTEGNEMASGGITSLGGYAHGGNPRLLRGPGDGMSDDIPATIADKQPARLADGEFVVPADVVSGLGNGSTEAGAKKLHQMMDKVRVDRTGTKKQGKQIKAEKYVPGLAKGGIASYAKGNLVVNPDTNEVGYWTNQNEWGFGGEWNPITQEQYNQTQTSAPVSATANTTAQGYNPDYYNPQYYQNQLATQQGLLGAAQAKIPGLQNELAAYHYSTTPSDLYDLSNLSDTAKQNQQVNSWYQQYLGRNIGQGENFSSTQEGIMNSPEAQAWAAANAPLTEANAALAPIQQNITNAQQNIDRLANSAIKYDPYTVSNRPSAAEPQFYGNIYKPEYVNYEQPGYSLSGGLGQWSNVAGDTQRYVEGLYNTELGRGSDPEGMRFWNARLQSGALDPAQVRQGFWGSDEYRGLHPSIEMPTQMQPNVNQIANEQRLAQAEQLSNSQTAALNSRNLINASVAAGKNQPSQEKKARQGGILAVKR